jgi:hypothetical protein
MVCLSCGKQLIITATEPTPPLDVKCSECLMELRTVALYVPER